MPLAIGQILNGKKTPAIYYMSMTYFFIFSVTGQKNKPIKFGLFFGTPCTEDIYRNAFKAELQKDYIYYSNNVFKEVFYNNQKVGEISIDFLIQLL